MATRVTQSTKVILVDANPAALGGTQRITQTVKVVVGTIQLAGGGLRQRGFGQ